MANMNTQLKNLYILLLKRGCYVSECFSSNYNHNQFLVHVRDFSMAQPTNFYIELYPKDEPF